MIRSADVKSGFDDEVEGVVEARQDELFSEQEAVSTQSEAAAADAEVDE
jgi:hypothetical protein